MNVLLGALKKIRSAFTPKPVVKRYSSFAEAKKECAGYTDPSIAQVVVQKTIRLEKEIEKKIISPDQDLQWTRNLQAFQSFVEYSGAERVTVIDYGGAAGAAYFQIASHHGDAIQRWTVVETTSMLKTVENNFQRPKLRFSDSLSETLDHTDLLSPVLIFAQGVLNFVENPFADLRRFMEKKYLGIYISRTAFIDEPHDFIYRFETDLSNHGPGILENVTPKKTSYPLTILSSLSFNALIKELGYRVKLEFQEGEEYLTPGITIKNKGFLLISN